MSHILWRWERKEHHGQNEEKRFSPSSRTSQRIAEAFRRTKREVGEQRRKKQPGKERQGILNHDMRVERKNRVRSCISGDDDY